MIGRDQSGLLIQGEHMDNKALHFNPRFDAAGGWFSGKSDNHIVLNSFISGQWGAEDRFPNVFEEGQPFQVRILCLQDYFKIAVNGRHLCDYPHRISLDNIKTVFVSGNIRVDFIEFQPPLRINYKRESLRLESNVAKRVMCGLFTNGFSVGNNVAMQPVGLSMENEMIHLQPLNGGAGDGVPVVTPPAAELKETKVEKPSIPFMWNVPAGGFVAPQVAKFTVTPFLSGKRFCINFLSKGEYFLHFRVDLSSGHQKPAVVRNSTKSGHWQKEERQIGQYPFSKGITSDIHFKAYGKSIAVTQREYLCCGLLIQGEHMDNKALHFNPRFDAAGGWFSGKSDNHIVLNSFISGQWGAEDRFPNVFEEGQPFQVRILCLQDYFKIAVNGRHLCDYPHRISLDNIKTVFVSGNIRVDFIEFQPPLRINYKRESLRLESNVAKRVMCGLFTNGFSVGNNVAMQPVGLSMENEMIHLQPLNGGAGDGVPVVTPPAAELKETKVEKPSIPFMWNVPAGGFVAPQVAKFTVTPFLSGKRFCINFLSKGEYFLHFRVDLSSGHQKPAVVRNSTKSGHWQKEERQIGQYPFSKGITSDIHFKAYGKSIAVDVDGMPFVKWHYREGNCPTVIDQIFVEGDMVLHRFAHLGPPTDV